MTSGPLNRCDAHQEPPAPRAPSHAPSARRVRSTRVRWRSGLVARELRLCRPGASRGPEARRVPPGREMIIRVPDRAHTAMALVAERPGPMRRSRCGGGGGAQAKPFVWHAFMCMLAHVIETRRIRTRTAALWRGNTNPAPLGNPHPLPSGISFRASPPTRTYAPHRPGRTRRQTGSGP